ncbi:MAG: hypothetical protein ACI8V5_004149 [Limisphaerales bacterium]|jgi:hypothetical protein
MFFSGFVVFFIPYSGWASNLRVNQQKGDLRASPARQNSTGSLVQRRENSRMPATIPCFGHIFNHCDTRGIYGFFHSRIKFLISNFGTSFAYFATYCFVIEKSQCFKKSFFTRLLTQSREISKNCVFLPIIAESKKK